MKFKAYDVTKLTTYRNRDCNVDFIDEFVNANIKCVKVEDYPHKTAGSCATALRHASKRSHHKYIKVMVRGNDVFLINTAID